MTLHWIPEPQSVRRTGGVARLPTNILLTLPSDAPANLRTAAHAFAAFLRQQFRLRPVLRDPGSHLKNGFRIELVSGSSANDEAYSLSIQPHLIRISGQGAPGLFYGIQTLTQLLRQSGTTLPCLMIRDAPAFAHRGFYLDISRGRVPQLSTLKRLIDMLAALKINQLQLYVEHVFDFQFDRSIGAGSSPLTADDMRTLDAFCSERFIQFVPSLACFGHMGKVLSLPAYRACAEAPWPALNWAHATWLQRLRGATLNPTLSASRRLLSSMLDEFLPLFSSPFFNMCGDETYDLGVSQKSKRHPLPIPDLYAQLVGFLHDKAASHGKRLMLWGDVLLHYPKAIRKLPHDCCVLDWGYSPTTKFEKVKSFLDAGMEAIVCPSTRGYRVVFNEVEEARGNIAGYARAAKRFGAAGVLTTDWGDMGHFNMLPCSYHGMALGAAMSWNPRSDEHRRFDAAFSQLFADDPTGRFARLYKHAGTAGVGEWPSLLRGLRADAEAPQRATRVKAARSTVRSCINLASRLQPSGWLNKTDISQLRLAVQALDLTAAKTLVEGAVSTTGGHMGQRSAAALRTFADRLDDFRKDYAAAWIETCRPSALRELDNAFRRSVLHARSLAASRRLPDGDPDAFQPLLRRNPPAVP